MPRSKQYNHLRKARLNRKKSTPKSNVSEPVSTDLYSDSTDTISNDEYQNSENSDISTYRQALIDQIISLTCGLTETSVILLKEIAQQLTNDQYSNEK